MTQSVTNNLKSYIIENRRPIGNFLKITTLFLGALAFLLFVEYHIQAKESSLFSHDYGNLPFSQTKLLISLSTKLANELKIATEVFGFTALGTGIASCIFLYGTKRKESETCRHKTGRHLNNAGTIFKAIALAALILYIVHNQESVAIQNSLGKYPIPGIQDMIGTPKKVGELFHLISMGAGGVSLLCGISSYFLLRTKEKEVWTQRISKMSKTAAIISLLITGMLIMQSIIHAKEAAYMNASFGNIPLSLPGINELVTNFYQLSDTLKYGAIIAGIVTLNFALIWAALKEDQSRKNNRLRVLLA